MATATKTAKTADTKAPEAQQSRPAGAQVREGVDQVRHGVEKTVNTAVGAVLVSRDWVADTVQVWTDRDAAQKEIEKVRATLNREIDDLANRGSSAVSRVETEVRERREKAQKTAQDEVEKLRGRVDDAIAKVSGRAEPAGVEPGEAEVNTRA